MKKGKKTPSVAKRDRNPLSPDLRKISRAIGRGRHERALTEANRLLASPRISRLERGRILSQVADSEFKRGRFEKAASIHLQAASATIGDARLWLRPYIGQIRALLKIPDVDQAVMMARHAVSVAESKMEEFNRQIKQANRNVSKGTTLQIPSVPIRVSVVSSRLAELFMKEGEPEAAEEFYKKALTATPRGANKARQGLAKIALRQHKYNTAADTAMDAIRRGKHGKKTMDAWKTLIAARRGTGRWRISENLIRGLDKTPAGIRARTILLITSELRKNDMKQWREVADAWLENEGQDFPIIATDIKKMKLASVRLAVGQLDVQQETAADLLQMPNLAKCEWLLAAKEWVRTGLLSGESVDVDTLLSGAEQQYGAAFVPQARHGLALACMMAKRHDLARPLLQANIADLPPDTPQWGKSVWALAHMEALLNNHTTSAHFYELCADNPHTPARFRLQAQLLWCEELTSSGDTEAMDQAYAKITTILSTVNDPEVLLNFARQIQLAPGQALRSRAQNLFEAGKILALEQFYQAENPALAMRILFKLARRQVVDFGDGQSVIDLWEGLSDEKQDWLWADTNHFWEYQGLVFSAYLESTHFRTAEAFALGWLNDPATPMNKRLYLGIPYMQALMDNGNTQEALVWCKTVTVESPSHPLSARAWYWLAVSAYAQNEMEKAAEYAQSLRQAQGVHIGLLEEWILDAKALLVQTTLEVNAVKEISTYDLTFLAAQRNQIMHDAEGMSK